MKHNARILIADLDNSQHAAAIIAVLDTYACDPVGGGEPLRAEVRAQLVPDLARLGNSLVLLAFAADDRPVGLAICFFGYSTFKAQPLLNVHDLAVIPDWRGRGVGRGLLTEAERQARLRACCKLTLEVQDGNLPALGLYRDFGFGNLIVGAPKPTRFLEKPLA
jgi:ribosomal protein S18 acetylase RimI-like enzyme